MHLDNYSDGVSEMKSLLHQLEQSIESGKLTELASLIQREYDLTENDSQLWSLVKKVFAGYIAPVFFAPIQATTLANSFINELIFRFYPSERVVKYNFVQKIIDYKDEVCFFEMVVDSRRADFCRINGSSMAYEIKTELDNLDRLPEQIEAYSKVFEYVHVIAHEKHQSGVSLAVPDYCGILTFRVVNGNCLFKYQRPALLSPALNPEAQVRNLSSQDMARVLEWAGQPNLRYKADRADLILKALQPWDINTLFKRTLRAKYASKWRFLQSNFADIYPIDMQAFFSQPIDPKIVYSRPNASSSSIA